MTEKFAQVMITNLDKKIRFQKDNSVKQALKEYRNTIIETMSQLGHDIGHDIII